MALREAKCIPTQYDQVSEVLRTSHKDKIKYKAQHTAHLQTELTKYQQRLEKLYEAHLDGDLDDEFYKRKVDEYRSARDSVKVKLDATDKADDSFYTAVDNLIRLGQSAPQLLESSEMEYRRRLFITVSCDWLRSFMFLNMFSIRASLFSHKRFFASSNLPLAVACACSG